jgi:hypothetical protein
LHDFDGGDVAINSAGQGDEGSSDVDGALSVAHDWLAWDRL